MTQQTITAVPIERQILSATLNRPELVSTVKAEGIRDDDFTDGICKMLYDRIFNHGETDTAILANSLPELAEEILQIQCETVTTDHVPEWCTTLKEYTARRKIVEECRRLEAKALDRETPFLPELKEGISSLLKQQNRMEVRKSRDVAESFREYREQMEQGQFAEDILLYGLPFDSLIHHSKGEVFTLGAAPGTGKTSFALSAMLNMVRNKRKVALFSEEMPSRILFARLVANLANVPLGKVLAGKSRALCRPAENEIQRLIDGKRILIRGSGEYKHSVPGISAEMQKFHNEAGGLDWFCIDYVQTLQSGGKVRDRREEIDLAVEGVKQLAIEYHAACLLLSQLSRSGQKSDVPDLTALKESAHIEEASCIVGFLQKKDEGSIEMLVPKNRNGSVFQGNLIFQPEYARFSEHKYSAKDAVYSREAGK